jgi:hypothetical protein
MEDHIAKSRVAVVTVRPPATGAQIHFHIAAARWIFADLDDRSAEIRAALRAAKAGMKNADRLAV